MAPFPAPPTTTLIWFLNGFSASPGTNAPSDVKAVLCGMLMLPEIVPRTKLFNVKVTILTDTN